MELSLLQSHDISDLPIMIVIRQPHELISWTVPYVGSNNTSYDSVSHTICPELLDGISEEETISVVVSTSSKKAIGYNFTANFVRHYNLQMDKELPIMTDPASPQYYLFTFPNGTDTVLVTARSENNSMPICAYLSVQDAVCPIRDELETVRYNEGIFQTMTSTAAITVKKVDYRLNMFVVVLIVLPDDEMCLQNIHRITPLAGLEKIKKTQHRAKLPTYSQNTRTKRITIQVARTQEDYSIPIVATFGSIFAVWIFTWLFLVIHENTRKCCDKSEEPNEMACRDTSQSGDITVADIPHHSPAETIDQEKPHINELRKKYNAYVWNIVVVAIFYGLPVVQFVLIYQLVSNTNGNQDTCYYNFLCAKPLWEISAFNNVFSNIVYVMLGSFFMFLVRYRVCRKCCSRDRTGNGSESTVLGRGNTLFYALGLALIMEGVMSGTYHICPRRVNYQFDTAFMYIMTCLGMIKLYQQRHPDKIPEAYVSFFLFALILLIGCFGLHFHIRYRIVFSSIFCCLYLICTMMMIWVLAKAEDGHKKCSCSSSIRGCIPRRYIQSILFGVSNVVLNGIFLYLNLKHWENIPLILLFILIVNFASYACFYVFCKCCFGEKIFPVVLMFLLLSLAIWIWALIIFISGPTEWQETAAMSRARNHPCVLLDFYDSHDVWYFLSACALFFSFVAIMLLDDDLRDKPANDIKVF